MTTPNIRNARWRILKFLIGGGEGYIFLNTISINTNIILYLLHIIIYGVIFRIIYNHHARRRKLILDPYSSEIFTTYYIKL